MRWKQFVLVSVVLVIGWLTWWCVPVRPLYTFPAANGGLNRHIANRGGGLGGFYGGVYRGRISPDGCWALSYSRGKDLPARSWLFDVVRGRETVELPPHVAPISFSPDSSLLVSRGTINISEQRLYGTQVWDVSKGEVVATCPPSDTLRSDDRDLLFSPGSRYLAYAAGSTNAPEVFVWDRQSPQSTKRLANCFAPVCISADERWLACSVAENPDKRYDRDEPWKIGVFAIPTARQTATYEVDWEPPWGKLYRQLALSSDGRRLAICSWSHDGHRIDVVDALRGSLELTCQGKGGNFTEELLFSANGDFLGLVGEGHPNVLELWQVRENPPQRIRPDQDLYQLFFGLDGRRAFFTKDHGGQLTILRLDDKDDAPTMLDLDPHLARGPVRAISGDRRHFVVGLEEEYSICDAYSGKREHSLARSSMANWAFLVESRDPSGEREYLLEQNLGQSQLQLWELPPRKRWSIIVGCWIGEAIVACGVAWAFAHRHRPVPTGLVTDGKSG